MKLAKLTHVFSGQDEKSWFDLDSDIRGSKTGFQSQRYILREAAVELKIQGIWSFAEAGTVKYFYHLNTIPQVSM